MSTKPTLPVLEPSLDEGLQSRSQPLPPWNVVLLDDNDHTYEYVVEMLLKLFGLFEYFPLIEEGSLS